MSAVLYPTPAISPADLSTPPRRHGLGWPFWVFSLGVHGLALFAWHRPNEVILPPVPLAVTLTGHVGAPHPVPVPQVHPTPEPATTHPVKASHPVPTPVTVPHPIPSPKVAPARPTPEAKVLAVAGPHMAAPAAPAPGGGSPAPTGTSGANAGGVAAPSGDGAPAPLHPPSFNADYLNNPAPVYPSLARRQGVEGRVVLDVLVTPEGKVRSLKLRQSSGSTALDEAAQAAVREWRFVPARRGDTPVEAWVGVPVAFHMSH